jgi:hypothetical protein
MEHWQVQETHTSIVTLYTVLITVTKEVVSYVNVSRKAHFTYKPVYDKPDKDLL